MNNQDIDALFNHMGISTAVQRLDIFPSVRWLFQAGGFPVFVQTQEPVNRMRIVALIKKCDEADRERFPEMLLANYHSALDVRYALTDDEYLVATFLHPLNELTASQFVQALTEVISCAETFGEDYSAGALYFGSPGSKRRTLGQPADPVSNLRSKVNEAITENRVFISYSHKDERWLDKLTTMLKPLIRDNSMPVWYDGNIKSSQEWRKEIYRAMQSSRVAVLLVSPEFLASDFIVEEELSFLLSAANEGQLAVTWLLLSPCFHKEAGISKYQALHNIERPLIGLSEAELSVTLFNACVRLQALTNSAREHPPQ